MDGFGPCVAKQEPVVIRLSKFNYIQLLHPQRILLYQTPSLYQS